MGRSSISRGSRAFVCALSVRMRRPVCRVSCAALRPISRSAIGQQADRHLLPVAAPRTCRAGSGSATALSSQRKQPVRLAGLSPKRRRRSGGPERGTARRAWRRCGSALGRADRRAPLDDERHGATRRARGARSSRWYREAERVRQRSADFHRPRDAWREVEIALRIDVDEIRGGRCDLVAESHREHRLDARRLRRAGDRSSTSVARRACTRARRRRASRATHSATSPSGARRAVRVDVVDVGRRHRRVAHRVAHAARGTAAVFGRCRDVMRIGTHPVTGELAIHPCVARLRMLVLLEHEDASAPPARSRHGRRPTAGFRGGIVVARRQCARRREAADAERRYGGFRTAGNHHVRVAAVFDAPRRFTEVLAGRRAR